MSSSINASGDIVEDEIEQEFDDTGMLLEGIGESINNKVFLLVHAAIKLVSDVVKENPDAQGIVLLAHSEKAPAKELLEPLCGIEIGTKQLSDVFADLGLAVVHLGNPQKAFLNAVVKVMSSIIQNAIRALYSMLPGMERISGFTLKMVPYHTVKL